MGLLKDILQETKIKVLDFVFPRHCLLCGKINPNGEFEYICPDCVHSIMYLNVARCTLCSSPIGISGMSNIHGCPQCFDRNLQFNNSLCLCAFSGVIREITHELKYKSGVYVLNDMYKIAKKNSELEDFIRNAILVPIPLHNIRALHRKYNQSELIANMLTKGFPDTNSRTLNLLKRTKNTPTQTTLDRISRSANIKNAFTLKESKELLLLPKNTKIILVDDVMTSGATLSECAKVLKKSGFKNVSAFTFAKRL